MKFFKLQIIILILTFGKIVTGQDTIPKLQIIGKVEKDGIKLRWGINDAYLWQIALEEGYILERAVFDQSKPFENQNFSILTNSPIVKWTENEWNIFVKKFPESQNLADSIKYAYMSKFLSEDNLYLTGNESFEQQLEFYKNLKMKFAYALIAADQSWYGALIQGLGYHDQNVNKSINYIYKLSLNFKVPFYDIPPAYLSILNKENNSTIEQKIIIEEKDSKVILTFYNKGSSGYYIEVSDDGKNFSRVAKEPFYNLKNSETKSTDSIQHIIDSLINYKMYYFKIKAKTPFGDEILIGEIKGMPRDLTPPGKPFIVGAFHTAPDVATIKWDMKEPIATDLKGFVIGRSNEESGDYFIIHDKMIPLNIRSFEDKYFNKDGPNYYMIEAIDTSGNKSMSSSAYLTLIDSVPPGPPIHIKSKMDSLGIVTINLEHQKEKDFMGFRLYKANADYHEFSVVHETYNDTIVVNARNPVIIDTSTLKSLTKYVYYKVTALDYHYNESKFSEIIKVPRPDKIPPVPPLINDYVTTDKEIRLSITASSSSDIRQNYLYRKKDTDKEWLLLDSLGIKNTAYSDQTTENNVFYLYTVRAIDDSGLKSEFGNVIRIRTYYKPRPLDMTIFCTYFTADKQTLVTWKLNEQIKEEIAFEMYDLTSNVEKDIGRASPATPDIFVFKTDKSPEIIGIKAYTETKEYLISVSPACIISKAKIEEDERFKKYQKNASNR